MRNYSYKVNPEQNDDKNSSNENPQSGIKSQSDFKNYQLSNSSLSLFLIFSGLIALFGTFSPWISAGSNSNVTGTNTKWGLITFIASVFVIFYGTSGLSQNEQISSLRVIARQLSLIFSISGVIALVFLFKSALEAKSKIQTQLNLLQSQTNDSALGNLTTLLGDSLKNLQNLAIPRVGFGLYICGIGLVGGLILSLAEESTSFLADKKNSATANYPNLSRSIFIGLFIFSIVGTAFIANDEKQKGLASAKSAIDELNKINNLSPEPSQSASPQGSNPSSKSAQPQPTKGIAAPTISSVTGQKGAILIKFKAVKDSNGKYIEHYFLLFDNNSIPQQAFVHISQSKIVANNGVVIAGYKISEAELGPFQYQKIASGNYPFYIYVQAQNYSVQSIVDKNYPMSESYFFDFAKHPEIFAK